MIETLTGFPDCVVALTAKGRVTREDYEHVLIPKIRDAFSRHERIRCLYELGADFSGMDAGAAWEDFKLGIGHLRGWERVAVVTDTAWIRSAIEALRFLVPGEVKVFGTRDSGDARRWISADLPV
jgi:hypothetical protein